MLTRRELFERRRRRVRYGLRKAGDGRPRLSVFRSNRYIYAQIVDDRQGRTLVAASSLEKDLREGPGTGNRQAARAVGARLAERAAAAGVKDVVFDRGGYRYHGRVKALADAAREGGLSF